MGTWNTRGLRGSTLEEMINRSLDKYREGKLALIQKVPTPITPIRIDKESRQITLAYFDQKSTVDYIGVVQGIPICFDAKECHTDTFPLRNIHEHQMNFMREFEEQDGISFFIVHFTHRDELFYLPWRKVYAFWQRGMTGGRKSFTYDELGKDDRLSPNKGGILVPFLEGLQRDLAGREEQETVV